MKAAIRMNEAVELRDAALTEQAVEQVSGGINEIDEVHEAVIYMVLAATKDRIIKMHFGGEDTEHQFQTWVKNPKNFRELIVIMSYFSTEVAGEYASWTEDKKSYYWRNV